jgi:hypothetical protein
VSLDGGGTWSVVTATKSLCTSGTADNGGDYQRASDPWLAFAPNGDLYLMSLTSNALAGREAFGPTAMLVSKSSDGGLTWDDLTTLIRDSNPNVINDKNTITADPNDQGLPMRSGVGLYSHPEDASPSRRERLHLRGNRGGAAYRGSAWFARTTDGGATWELARQINDSGEGAQAFGMQIVVVPDNDRTDGELVMLSVLGYKHKNAHGVRDENLRNYAFLGQGRDVVCSVHLREDA